MKQDHLQELDAMIKTGSFAWLEDVGKEVKTIAYADYFLKPLLLGPAIEETWRIDLGFSPVIL